MQRAERVKYVCDDRVRESGVPTCGSCGALSPRGGQRTQVAGLEARCVRGRTAEAAVSE